MHCAAGHVTSSLMLPSNTCSHPLNALPARILASLPRQYSEGQELLSDGHIPIAMSCISPQSTIFTESLVRRPAAKGVTAQGSGLSCLAIQDAAAMQQPEQNKVVTC